MSIPNLFLTQQGRRAADHEQFLNQEPTAAVGFVY
jgi:hypothetical protein